MRAAKEKTKQRVRLSELHELLLLVFNLFCTYGHQIDGILGEKIGSFMIGGILLIGGGQVFNLIHNSAFDEYFRILTFLCMTM